MGKHPRGLWERLGKEPGRKGGSDVDLEGLSSSQAEGGHCRRLAARGAARTPGKGFDPEAQWPGRLGPSQPGFTPCALGGFLHHSSMTRTPVCLVLGVLALPPNPGTSLRDAALRSAAQDREHSKGSGQVTGLRETEFSLGSEPQILKRGWQPSQLFFYVCNTHRLRHATPVGKEQNHPKE